MAQSLIRKTQFTSATGAAAHAKRRPESNGKANLPTDLRDLRIQQVLEMRLKGMSVVTIAKEFNAHPDTIRDDIRKARQTGLITKYRHQLMKRLVPGAFRVIEHHLGQNNLKAAEQVMALFRSESDKQHEKEVAKESAEESLNDWWQRRKAALTDAEDPDDHPVNESALSFASAEFCTAEPIGRAAPTPTSPSGPPGSSPSGSTPPRVAILEAQRTSETLPGNGQTGLALSPATAYHFGPEGFSAFADAHQLGQDSEEAEEGI